MSRSTTPSDDKPPTGDFDVGVVVSDSDDEDRDQPRMLVVGRPDEQADEYECDWDAYMNPKTVADFNSDYPSDADVVEVVYFETLDGRYDDWRSKGVSYVKALVDEGRLEPYAFPKPRLTAEDVESPF